MSDDTHRPHVGLISDVLIVMNHVPGYAKCTCAATGNYDSYEHGITGIP